jgi:thioredoxin 1
LSSGPTSAALDGTMKALAKQEAGKLLLVQMNVKDSPETARRYNIRSAPAVVGVKNGQVQSQAENIDSTELERHARYLLGSGPKPEPKAQPQAAAAGAAGAYAGGTAGGSYGAHTQQQPGTDGHGGQPVTVTDASFEQEVMGSSIPVVVDFWAPWCGPCRMVAPVLDKLAREWNGRVKIAKVNVDENPNIAARYRITGIPTMMVVRSGQIIDQWAGALPEPALRQRLSQVAK